MTSHTPAPLSAEQLAAIRQRADEATPGPWEHGDRYHVQAADRCECRPEHGPLVNEARMDINGQMRLAHVHRSEVPWWEYGIYAFVDGRPSCVLVEADEYGAVDPDDAAFIAAARSDVPALVDEVERLREVVAWLVEVGNEVDDGVWSITYHVADLPGRLRAALGEDGGDQ